MRISEGQWVRKPFEGMLRHMDSKTHNFCPSEHLGGGTAPLSPFRRSPHSAHGSLSPLLGQDLYSRPATKRAYPLGIPNDLCPMQSTNQTKAARFQASLSSWTFPSRNRARSAFKRFFPHKPSHNLISFCIRQKLRVFRIHWP